MYTHRKTHGESKIYTPKFSVYTTVKIPLLTYSIHFFRLYTNIDPNISTHLSAL